MYYIRHNKKIVHSTHYRKIGIAQNLCYSKKHRLAHPYPVCAIQPPPPRSSLCDSCTHNFVPYVPQLHDCDRSSQFCSILLGDTRIFRAFNVVHQLGVHKKIHRGHFTNNSVWVLSIPENHGRIQHTGVARSHGICSTGCIHSFCVFVLVERLVPP